MCEYTGILKKSCDVDNVKDNNYIFAIDCLETIKSLNGRKVLIFKPLIFVILKIIFIIL